MSSFDWENLNEKFADFKNLLNCICENSKGLDAKSYNSFLDEISNKLDQLCSSVKVVPVNTGDKYSVKTFNDDVKYFHSIIHLFLDQMKLAKFLPIVYFLENKASDEDILNYKRCVLVLISSELRKYTQALRYQSKVEGFTSLQQTFSDVDAGDIEKIKEYILKLINVHESDVTDLSENEKIIFQKVVKSSSDPILDSVGLTDCRNYDAYIKRFNLCSKKIEDYYNCFISNLTDNNQGRWIPEYLVEKIRKNLEKDGMDGINSILQSFSRDFYDMSELFQIFADEVVLDFIVDMNQVRPKYTYATDKNKFYALMNSCYKHLNITRDRITPVNIVEGDGKITLESAENNNLSNAMAFFNHSSTYDSRVAMLKNLKEHLDTLYRDLLPYLSGNNETSWLFLNSLSNLYHESSIELFKQNCMKNINYVKSALNGALSLAPQKCSEYDGYVNEREDLTQTLDQVIGFNPNDNIYEIPCSISNAVIKYLYANLQSFDYSTINSMMGELMDLWLTDEDSLFSGSGQISKFAEVATAKKP